MENLEPCFSKTFSINPEPEPEASGMEILPVPSTRMSGISMHYWPSATSTPLPKSAFGVVLEGQENEPAAIQARDFKTPKAPRINLSPIPSYRPPTCEKEDLLNYSLPPPRNLQLEQTQSWCNTNAGTGVTELPSFQDFLNIGKGDIGHRRNVKMGSTFSYYEGDSSLRTLGISDISETNHSDTSAAPGRSETFSVLSPAPMFPTPKSQSHHPQCRGDDLYAQYQNKIDNLYSEFVTAPEPLRSSLKTCLDSLNFVSLQVNMERSRFQQEMLINGHKNHSAEFCSHPERKLRVDFVNETVQSQLPMDESTASYFEPSSSIHQDKN